MTWKSRKQEAWVGDLHGASCSEEDGVKRASDRKAKESEKTEHQGTTHSSCSDPLFDQGPIRPLSASFLSRPEISTEQPSHSSVPLQVARQECRPVFSPGILTQQPSLLALGLYSWCGWLRGAALEHCLSA